MRKPIKIKRWLCDGHHVLSADGIEDTDDLLAAAGRALDKACSHDIMGEILFEGDDGNFYVGTVEFTVSLSDPDYVRETLAYLEDQECT